MMKKTLYILLAMIILASCKQPVDILEPVADFASIKLSTLSSVISEEGGEKSIYVASNREEWDADCKQDWVSISIDDNMITFYVDENPGADTRLAVIDVVAGTYPDVAKARFKLLQKGHTLVNLSTQGTANTYIVSTNSSYCFDAGIKGNGAGDGNTFYIGYEGIEIEGATHADLLWESTFDGDKTRSTKIIAGTPVYIHEEKAIYLTTGDIEGNAVVGVRNGEGEILWSWHIWVVNDDIKTSSHNGIEWMDRNLGALNNDPEDVANRGMLYQWGRKDPFLPSPKAYMEVPFHTYDENGNLTETEEEYIAIQDQIEQARVVLNVNNEQTGDGSLEWQYIGVAPVALQAPGNIEYSVQNPTTFLGCRTDIPIGEYVFDWYLQQDLPGKTGLMMQSQSGLWGEGGISGQKTIFDPCPPGWTVPPRGAFDEIPSGYACTYVDSDWEKDAYGWTWKGGNGDYFPSTGNLDVSGLIGETSEKLLYWTAESFGSENQGFGKAGMLFVAFNELYYGIYPILDGAEAAAWYSYGAKCMAASVRCVKEY